ncbi:hypothetical protein LCGC14_1854640 [marine sediment metagenome]|uniref:Uncharacterized protein n=1 Tax=marine sediment metagenome TaxID=412755 RepID=A0A0F9G982_9ZZZZ
MSWEEKWSGILNKIGQHLQQSRINDYLFNNFVSVCYCKIFPKQFRKIGE